MLSFSGIVEDLLPNAMFRVKLENGHIVTAMLQANYVRTEFEYFKVIRFKSK